MSSVFSSCGDHMSNVWVGWTQLLSSYRIPHSPPSSRSVAILISYLIRAALLQKYSSSLELSLQLRSKLLIFSDIYKVSREGSPPLKLISFSKRSKTVINVTSSCVISNLSHNGARKLLSTFYWQSLAALCPRSNFPFPLCPRSRNPLK